MKLLLVLVLALGLWTRLDHLGHLLPYFPEPDNCVATQLWELERDVPREQRSSHFGAYPLLLARLGGLWPAADPPDSGSLADHLAAASTVTLRLRYLGAILSWGLIPLTWLLARRFLSPAGAVLAAFLVATSLLHLVFSQQARPHAPHATLALLSVLASLALRNGPSWKSYSLAGGAALLAIATLQSGIAVLLPLLLAHLLRNPTADANGGRHGRMALVLAGIGLGSLLFYPSQSSPSLDQGLAIRSSAHRVAPADFNGDGLWPIHRYLRDHDPALYLLAVVGIVLALARIRGASSRRDLVVLLGYAVPYFAMIAMYRNTMERFLLPLLPYLACLAAYAVTRAWSIVRGLPGPKALTTSAAAVVCAAPLVFVLVATTRYIVLRDTKDAVQQATDWLLSHISPDQGSFVVTPGLTMPVFHDPATFENNTTPILESIWVRYQAQAPPATIDGPRYALWSIPWSKYNTPPEDCPRVVEEMLTEVGAEFAVIEVSARVMHRSPISRELYRQVQQHGTLLFAAEGEPIAGKIIQRPLDYQNMWRMFRRMFRANCMGPRVEIWRLTA